MLLFLLGCVHALGPGAIGPSDARLPLDPAVQRGTLANGLIWMVQENGYPDNRVELRLVVKAGSLLEDDDQRGLAHVLEHMAFKSSAHFAEGELVTWFESVGMRYGAHLNAYTSFEETVYKVGVPTDDPATVDKALLVLRDWAGAMTLEDSAIERERGVVLEEWRKGLGASDRVFRAVAPALFAGSIYGERLPIGTEASLRGFSSEALRRFCADWYRPDLMSVIVVGEVDGAAMQARIEATFGDLAGPAAPRPRPTIDVPAHPDTLVTVVTDPEIPTPAVMLTVKIDDPQEPTFGASRAWLVRGLLAQVLNERLATGVSTRAILGGGAGYQRLSATEASWRSASEPRQRPA